MEKKTYNLSLSISKGDNDTEPTNFNMSITNPTDQELIDAITLWFNTIGYPNLEVSIGN